MLRAHWILLLVGSAIVGMAPGTIAAEDKPIDARLAPVAPLLDNLTIALVRVDMRRVDPAKAEKLALLVGLSATAGFDVADLRHDLEIMVKSFLESGGEDLFFVATLADISSSPPFVAIPIRNGAKPERLLKWLEQTDRVVRQQQGNVVIGSSQAVADRLKSLQPFRHRAIEEAFAIPEDSPVQVIVSLPVEVRPFLTQLYPKLPREIGGGSTQAIVDNVEWASLGFTLSPALVPRLTIKSKSEAGAKELEATLRQINGRIAELPAVKQSLSDSGKLFARLQPQVDGDRLVTRLNADESESILQELAAGPIAQAQRSALQTQSMNNLKQIGLAMHNYHDRDKKFPPAASRSKDGKPLLSWRVHLLPFLGQQALYDQFKLDEPWDGPNNRPLATTLPKVYLSPSALELAKEGKTRYVAPTGKKSIFESPQGTPIVNVLDGTSNTVLVLETIPAKAVVWTKPDDWDFDANDPGKGIVDEQHDGWLSLFADGSVRLLPKKLDKQNFRRLLQMNDGEIIDPF